jgi:hypothetical protein
VVFEKVDVPGSRTRDGIAEIEGDHPGKAARGERGDWFRDSEGNMLGVGEPVVRGENIGEPVVRGENLVDAWHERAASGRHLKRSNAVRPWWAVAAQQAHDTR